MNTNMSINLHINRLILDMPLSQRDRLILQSTVESELTRLLTDDIPPHFHHGDSIPALTVNEIQLPIGNNPTQLGQQLAQSLYQGLSQPNSATGTGP
jgi:hypothetical protein